MGIKFLITALIISFFYSMGIITLLSYMVFDEITLLPLIIIYSGLKIGTYFFVRWLVGSKLWCGEIKWIKTQKEKWKNTIRKWNKMAKKKKEILDDLELSTPKVDERVAKESMEYLIERDEEFKKDAFSTPVKILSGDLLDTSIFISILKRFIN